MASGDSSNRAFSQAWASTGWLVSSLGAGDDDDMKWDGETDLYRRVYSTALDSTCP